MATEAATPSAASGGDPVRRVRASLIATLLLLAVVAWVVTDERMRGMDAGPGTDLGGLGFWVGVWVVMMAAMMFPSIAPMVITHARISRRLREQGRATGATTGTFVAGYLLSWTAFGVSAYAIYGAVAAIDGDVLSWDRAGRWVAAGVIVGAALYQLTPAKDVCLRRCRSPLDLILGRWRSGHRGALRLGVEHGAWCVGCCWALMCALFAVGVMSIGWMAFFAALIAIEKLIPWGPAAHHTVTAALVVLGLGVALVPDRVPGLTLPDSGAAGAAIQTMHE
jgi:predicted metal-binding membrane protein